MKTSCPSPVDFARLTALGVFAFSPFSALAQGPLTPPGAPAPMMKSLDQVEPRTPLSQTDFGPVGSYTISVPGSYYLTSNVSTSAIFGAIIYISASNVALDLNGFTLTTTGDTDGIGITNNHSNITIRNGTVRGAGVRTAGGQPWEGTFSGSSRNGILTYGRSSGTETSSNVRLENLVVRGFSNGVQLRGFTELDGNRHQLLGLRVFDCFNGIDANLSNLSDVVVQRCSGFGIRSSLSNLDGIVAAQIGDKGILPDQAVLSRITVRFTGGNGIQGGNLAISDVNVSGAFDGISGNGISVDRAILTNNRSHGIVGLENTVRGIRANSNSGAGIYCDNSVISQSTATANGDDGIRGVGSVIVASRASGNDTNAGGYAAQGIVWTNGRIADSLADTAAPPIP